MANAVARALADLKHRIPKPILEQAFKATSNWRYSQRSPVAIDQRIRQLVINDRVIPDCNLTGGTEVFLDISQVKPERLPEGESLYRIPMALTGDRYILEVFRLIWGWHTGAGYNQSLTDQGTGGGALAGALSQLLDANSAMPGNTSTDIDLVGENTVISRATLVHQPHLRLHCRLSSDDEFSHLKPRAIRQFSELVTLATKAYIYNNTTITIDEGQLSGGMTLGRFTDIVDSYADANELYEELLNGQWQRVQILNDPVARKRHLRFVGGRRQ